MKKLGVWIGAATASSAVMAHAGHGFDGPHWHAADAIGLVLLALLAGGVAWWMDRQ